jgi:sensor histidine kinase YesM
MRNISKYSLSNLLISPHYRIYRHPVIIIVVFFVTSNLFAEETTEAITLQDKFYAWILYSLGMLSVIYINTYVLAPRLLLKNRILLYLVSVLILAWIVLIIISTIQGLFYERGKPDPEMNVTAVILSLLSSTLSLGLLIAGSSTLLLFKNWILYNQRISELTNNTLQTELKLLKSQINPHFLFNMLNNADLLIKKGRSEASEVLFKLEDLLRYQLSDSMKEEVPLRSDIRFLNDFLNLEKIRRDKFDYTISETGDIGHVTLPPLLFIPFIENAVKHNPESDTYISISFELQRHLLKFRCENPKPSIPIPPGSAGGIGLTNIKRRLELLYPDAHTLEIEDTEKTYTVYLTLHV